jgi:hypothetical protein
MLFPYLRSRDVFLCPSNPVGWSPPVEYWGEDIFKKGIGGWEQYRLPGDETKRFPISYCANVFVIRQGDEIDYPTNTTAYYIQWGHAVFLSEITDSSSTIAIGETRFRSWWDCGPSFWPHVVNHHNGRINYLFMDDSVKRLRAIQTFLPHSLWGPRNLIENYPNGEWLGRPLDPMKPDDSLIQRIGEEYR